jgi:hypothetical protein
MLEPNFRDLHRAFPASKKKKGKVKRAPLKSNMHAWKHRRTNPLPNNSRGWPPPSGPTVGGIIKFVSPIFCSQLPQPSPSLNASCECVLCLSSAATNTQHIDLKWLECVGGPFGGIEPTWVVSSATQTLHVNQRKRSPESSVYRMDGDTFVL